MGMEENGNKFGFLRLALYVLMFCSLAGFLSPFLWFFDLFNHFKWQAIFFSLLISALSLFINSPKHAALSFIVCVINVSLVIYICSQFEEPKNLRKVAEHEMVSIISANVLTSNTQYDRVITLIHEEHPDIFVAVEVNKKWVDALQVITSDYPYYNYVARDDNFGMAVYSKLPFSGDFEYSGEFNLPLGVFDFGKFSLLSIHTPPPMSSSYNKELKNYVSSALSLADVQNKPVVMAGDFNTTIWSENALPIIRSGFQSSSPRGLSWTYPTGNVLLAIQIDHIWGREVTFHDYESLEDVGSDHYPIFGRFSVDKLTYQTTQTGL